MSPLALISTGEKVEIVSHKGQAGGLPNCMEHVLNMGLRPGKHVEVLSNSGCGPLLLKVDESRIALGRGIAMKIYARRIME